MLGTWAEGMLNPIMTLSQCSAAGFRSLECVCPEQASVSKVKSSEPPPHVYHGMCCMHLWYHAAIDHLQAQLLVKRQVVQQAQHAGQQRVVICSSPLKEPQR